MNRTLKRFGLAAGAALMLTATTASALSPAGEGRRLFLSQNCYGCHGGRGGGGMGPNLRGGTEEDVEEYVRQGFPYGMPGFPNLTDRDIQNLDAYLRSLRTPAEPTFTHWWEPVPTQ